MNTLEAIAKIVVAVGAVLGAHLMLPGHIGVIVEAIIAAAAVFARSPLEPEPNKPVV